MRIAMSAATVLAAMVATPGLAGAETKTIDRGTKEGVDSVQGEWRFLPARV